MSSSLSAVLEQLLYEDEGTVLDFKECQYSFYGASDADKSELLKDILAFANSFRRTDAYILIGVEEKLGARSVVKGAGTHLRDSDLQQFVNSKTNRPIAFSYKVSLLDGREVGVIKIDLQERPFYLMKPYGKLKRSVVYIRRGSSTDEATLDEISKMGGFPLSTDNVQPDLKLEIAKPESHESAGSSTLIEVVSLDLPADGEIPDYAPSYGGVLSITDPLANQEFYRQFARFVKEYHGLREVPLLVENNGEGTAYGVDLAIEISDEEGVLWFLDAGLRQEAPSTRGYPFYTQPALLGIHSERFEFSRAGMTWNIKRTIGKVKPKERVVVCGLLVGAVKACSAELLCSMYGENLPNPIQANLRIRVAVEKKILRLDELREMAHESSAD